MTTSKTWIDVHLYDDEDNKQTYSVLVEYEYVHGTMGEGGDWSTNILQFPDNISEETKEKLRTEVYYMQEDILGYAYDDRDDYEQQVD